MLARKIRLLSTLQEKLQFYREGLFVTQQEFIFEAVLGDKAAFAFCQKIFNISQVMDDLVDKDKPVADDLIMKTFWDCLIEVPKNPFYMRHAPTLIPLMQVFLVDYRDSVLLERNEKLDDEMKDHGKNIAFVLRDSVGSIVTHCAYLVGGYDHMAQIQEKVRLIIFDESLEQYKEGLCQGIPVQTLKTQN